VYCYIYIGVFGKNRIFDGKVGVFEAECGFITSFLVMYMG